MKKLRALNSNLIERQMQDVGDLKRKIRHINTNTRRRAVFDTFAFGAKYIFNKIKALKYEYLFI